MPTEDGARLQVRAHPRADRDRIGPMVDGVLHVRVARPPADGEANRAVARVLADALAVAPSRLLLVAGARGRDKRFCVAGMSAEELDRRLASLATGGELD